MDLVNLDVTNVEQHVLWDVSLDATHNANLAVPENVRQTANGIVKLDVRTDAMVAEFVQQTQQLATDQVHVADVLELVMVDVTDVVLHVKQLAV